VMIMEMVNAIIIAIIFIDIIYDNNYDI
jgi:hypothetical protein